MSPKKVKHLATLLAGVFCALSGQGQIFVSDVDSGAVEEYSTSGTLMNPSVVSGLNLPGPIALDSSGNLYVVQGGASLTKYTSSGAEVWLESANLFLSPPEFTGIAVYGNNVYASDYANGSVLVFSTLNGGEGAPLITGLDEPDFLAASADGLYIETDDGQENNSILFPNAGSPTYGFDNARGIAVDNEGDIFVVNTGNGTVGEYTASGAVVNASLISGLDGPIGIALDGNGDLFVANAASGTIGEYTTSGQTVNASLISSLDGVSYIAVEDVPEPSSLTLTLIALIVMIQRRFRIGNRV